VPRRARRAVTIVADQPHQHYRIVAVVGHKNSGKTTLLERLVRRLTDAGVRVAAIKHTSDEHGFDKPHSDSDRLKRAGAVAVGLAARDEIGLYASRTPELSETWLETAIGSLPEPPDLILYEGYRGGPHAKIECILDKGRRAPSVGYDEGLLGIVSTQPIAATVPVIHPESINEIVDLILRHLRRR
jgi:molybdopterin-guanine dinucleotide biosynthesis protein MobB